MNEAVLFIDEYKYECRVRGYLSRKVFYVRRNVGGEFQRFVCRIVCVFVLEGCRLGAIVFCRLVSCMQLPTA